MGFITRLRRIRLFLRSVNCQGKRCFTVVELYCDCMRSGTERFQCLRIDRYDRTSGFRRNRYCLSIDQGLNIMRETARVILAALDRDGIAICASLCPYTICPGSDGIFLYSRSRYESPDVDGEILVRYDADVFGSLSQAELCGRFIEVRILGADDYDLIAEVVK